MIMPIYNETFYSYRDNVKEIHKAINLLVEHRYKIIDLENNIIDNTNVHKLENINY
jgi:hypothetical protein